MSIATSEPFKLVTTDFLMISSVSPGYRYALVFVDHFTIVILTKDQMAMTTAKLFWEHVVQSFGCLKQINLNQRQNFASITFSELCCLSGIRKLHTTPYHPKGNRVCEWFNHTLLGMLRTLELGHCDCWHQHVGAIVWASNNMVHRATRHTPFLLSATGGLLAGLSGEHSTPGT